MGVTSVNYYDAVGRRVRTELPDGSFSRVEFSPWHVASYDPNDTAFDSDPAKQSDWYKRRMDPTHPRFAEFNKPENIRAAELMKRTPTRPRSLCWIVSGATSCPLLTIMSATLSTGW